MHRRQKTKQVGNKTREDLMTAYHTMKGKNDERNRENPIQSPEGMAGVPSEPDKNPGSEM